MNSPAPFLQLPLPVDLAGLRRDLLHCLQQTWPEHFNSRDYAGSWKVIALRSPDGSTTSAYAHGSTFQDSPLMPQCPAIQGFLAQLQCPLEAVRLLCLATGSQIHTHTDQGLSYLDGTFRLHVPLETHPDARFTIGGEVLHMPEGTCWYGNFSLPHSVDNLSPKQRIHLVVDANRNDWTDRLFSEAGMDLEAERRAFEKKDPQHWKRVATELERMGSELGLQLAKEVRVQHGLE